MPAGKLKCAALLFLCLLVSGSSSCGNRSTTAITPEIVVGLDQPPVLLRAGSLKFAVVGDAGRWSTEQRETAAQLVEQHGRFRFDFVLMLGDNNYGDGSPESYAVRFEQPFKPLIDAQVKFYAVVGNHDEGPQWNYPLFNMGGHRYYTFDRSAGVVPPVGTLGTKARFFAVDTVNLDGAQMEWLDRELSDSKADWNIVYQHHPIYSSGRYAISSRPLRRTLEQTFIEHEVDVVFAGHEHFYERMQPQNGVMYFVNGAAGSVRVGDLRPTSYQAKGYDRDLSFMLIEIAGDTLYFQAIDRLGETVDAGKIIKRRISK